MKIYVTKDALRGIVEAEAPMVAAIGGVAVLEDGTVLQGHEWRATLEEAGAEFEKQKADKLTEIVDRYDKVAAMKIRVVKVRPKVRTLQDSQTQGWVDVIRK